jgi:DNA-binding CsgD family transcriptional regulator
MSPGSVDAGELGEADAGLSGRIEGFGREGGTVTTSVPIDWTPAAIATLRREWAAVRSYEAIGRMLGISEHRVSLKAIELGLPPRRPRGRPFGDDDRAVILAMANGGASFVAIGARIGRSRETVSHYLWREADRDAAGVWRWKADPLPVAEPVGTPRVCPICRRMRLSRGPGDRYCDPCRGSETYRHGETAYAC